MKALNKNNIEKMCKYCELASELFSPDEMICKKRGVVPSGYKCRHFSYDPLKREPHKLKLITNELEFPEIDN